MMHPGFLDRDDEKWDDVPEESYHEAQADGVPEDDDMEQFVGFPALPASSGD